MSDLEKQQPSGCRGSSQPSKKPEAPPDFPNREGVVHAVNDQGDGCYDGYDFEGLTRAIAEFIAEGANGQIEVDNGDAFTIVF